MSAFLAIVKLTCRAAVRSRVFLFLFGILILTIFLIPNTVSGDGTALAYIQVSLKYSLSAVSFILSLSTLWLACFTLAGDIESYQLHLVITKPVSRVTVWLGKCCGIMLIHLVLLVASGLIVYGFIMWQFHKRPFSEDEKKRIEEEVMVGRRVSMPEYPDVEQMVKNEYRKRLSAEGSTQHMGKQMVTEEIRKQVISRLGEIKYGNSRYWFFKNVRTRDDHPVFLRYRVYIGQISSRDQRETVGAWGARVRIPESPDQPDGPTRNEFVPLTQYPEKIMCGLFYEKALAPIIVNEEREAILVYTNLDLQREAAFFQMADGPKLLVRVCGFEGNYARAMIMISLKLIFLAALACAAGAVFSTPVAIFLVFSYLMLGIFASYLVGLEAPVADITMANLSIENIHDLVGRWVSEILLFGIIPIHQFEVAEELSGGELIEWFKIGKIFVRFMLIKGLPLFALGIWLYRRRELGLIIRR